MSVEGGWWWSGKIAEIKKHYGRSPAYHAAKYKNSSFFKTVDMRRAREVGHCTNNITGEHEALPHSISRQSYVLVMCSIWREK